MFVLFLPPLTLVINFVTQSFFNLSCRPHLVERHHRWTSTSGHQTAVTSPASHCSTTMILPPRGLQVDLQCVPRDHIDRVTDHDISASSYHKPKVEVPGRVCGLGVTYATAIVSVQSRIFFEMSPEEGESLLLLLK